MTTRRKFVPIQKKLLLFIIFPAVVIAIAGFKIIMNADLLRLQNELIEETRSHASLLSQDFARLITANDNAVKTDLIDRLSNFPIIESIILYDANQNIVFNYSKSDSKAILDLTVFNSDKYMISNQLLAVLEQIADQDSVYGKALLQVSTQKIQSLRHDYLIRGSVIVLAFLFALALFFWQIRRYFLQPIQHLTETLMQSGDNQLSTMPLPVKHNDEIGQLFAGFNRMQKKVQKVNKALLDQKSALDAHALVTISDARGIITYANQKFVDLSGYSESELLGQNHRIVKSGVHGDEVYQQLYATVNAGNVWKCDVCSRAKDGSLYWAKTTIVPLLDEFGKPEQFIAIRTDISKQKDMEKVLQISEERLDMAMAVANDGIWDWHLDDNSVYFDSRYYTMAGYQPFAFAGELEQFQQRVHPDHIERVLALVQQYLAGESDIFDVEFKFKKADGDYMWIRGRGKIVERDNWGKPLRFVGTHTDISKRKLTEDKLRKSELRYRQIFENSQAVKLIIDPDDNRIIEANAAAAAFYGFDVATLTSMSISDIDSSSEIDFKPGMQEGSNKKKIRFDSRHQLASGEIRDVEVYSGVLQIEQKAYMYLIVQDISERIRAEKQLRRVQKMDAVGQLTGGIAHDFNNILGIISGNMTLLERRLNASSQDMDEKSLKRIDTIKHSTQRAIDLTRRLLNFSRSEAESVKTVEINRLIIDMQDLLTHSLTPQIAVELKLADDVWSSRIDPSDFEDALLNLLLNARDAMSGSGKIIIESKNISLDEVFCKCKSIMLAEAPEKTCCKYNVNLRPGDYIELSISDSGTGMSPEQQEHIFEPFYTTKEQGKGTGLGLAMVFGFITRSHGSIKVDSEPGMGTTFRLYLPRHLEPSAQQDLLPAENAGQYKELAHGTETILVVDDEAALLELVQESLQLLGYQVLTAGNGEQALQILEDNYAVEKRGIDKSIDLLFSDVVMPGMTGFELAEQAHKQYPELKILLTSGYTEKAIADSTLSKFTANVLSKPYSQQDMAQRLRQLLDGSA